MIALSELPWQAIDMQAVSVLERWFGARIDILFERAQRVPRWRVITRRRADRAWKTAITDLMDLMKWRVKEDL